MKKWIGISFFVWSCILFTSAYSQITLVEAQQRLKETYGDSMQIHYDRIYFIHPSFCSGTKYCGEGIGRVLKTIPLRKKVLVLTSNASFDVFTRFKSSNITYKEVNIYTIQQHGLFSVYPFYVDKNRIFYFK